MAQVPGPVRVWADTLTLPTYDEAAPDPNPAFALFTPDGPRYYPYTTRNGYTTKLAKQTWRTLELENEYLRCTILPDLGGRIYGCADKLNRHDLFYANPVIKKSAIGLRGAWAAAGTEFNFPIGHSWTTVSPVDFSTRQNPDGSASVFVGDTDLVDGMRWLVEIILRPGALLVEQHITLSNPGPIRHGYYWWNNAAIPAYEDTRFYLPCHLTSTHGQAGIEPWPVNKAGLDLSLFANHNSAGVARFSAACQESFMGVYSARESAGTAHYADPASVPGKKIWSWGSGQFGRDASKNYADDGGQYVELQAGLFRDQETFGFLNPGDSRQFTEYWMPIHGLGGISRVTPAAAIFMTRTGTEFRIAFQVYRRLPNAAIQIFYSDKAVLEEKLTLDPAKTEKRAIPNAKPGIPYRFELRDSLGLTLLAHTENLYEALPAITPAHETQDPGYVAESEGNLLLALKEYGADKPLATGRVLLALNRFDEAIQALSKAPPSPETRHYLGLAYLYSGNDEKARAEWSAARHDHVFGSVSRVYLSRLLARLGDTKAASVELEEALKARPDLAGARLPDPPEAPRDPGHLLLAVGPYLQSGMYQEALARLSRKYPEVPPLQREPGEVLPQDHPLVSYYRGYCRLKMGVSAKEDFALAAQQSTLYVFPNQPETLMVLHAAIAANPNDANAHYLLGSFFLAGGSVDPAIHEWQQAVKLKSTAPGLHASLGRLQRDVRKDTAAAAQTFREGIKVDPRNAAIQDSVKIQPGKPDEVAALALTMLESGRLAEAAALFTETNFPKERQSDTVRAAFIEARLRTIQDFAQRKRCREALAWVETIGDEAPGVPFSMYSFTNLLKGARIQYTLGNIESTCGETKAAKKRWAKAAKSADPSTPVEYAYSQLAAAALDGNQKLAAALAAVTDTPAGTAAERWLARGLLEQALGRTEAAASLQKALQPAPSDPMLRYLCQVAAGR